MSVTYSWVVKYRTRTGEVERIHVGASTEEKACYEADVRLHEERPEGDQWQIIEVTREDEDERTPDLCEEFETVAGKVWSP